MSTIPMHISSLMKICKYLLNILSGNENTDGGGQITVKNGRNLPNSNSKPDLHCVNAQTKFGENPLIFTQVVIRKRKTKQTKDGRTDVLQTDGQTDVQHETTLPGHYCVARHKKRRTLLYRNYITLKHQKQHNVEATAIQR